ncbi:Zinc finger protein AZF2 [Senna tora]|uniref:Zinc finger protein AZF2 n=1 Tax=Senna tora TaxID=362788 RepID=A0A834W319_9FABA|nr:Zinc finger protein AZF2 [Senna tora]
MDSPPLALQFSRSPSPPPPGRSPSRAPADSSQTCGGCVQRRYSIGGYHHNGPPAFAPVIVAALVPAKSLTGQESLVTDGTLMHLASAATVEVVEVEELSATAGEDSEVQQPAEKEFIKIQIKHFLDKQLNGDYWKANKGIEPKEGDNTVKRNCSSGNYIKAKRNIKLKARLRENEKYGLRMEYQYITSLIFCVHSASEGHNSLSGSKKKKKEFRGFEILRDSGPQAL